jgi:hypothetical protein
MNSGIAASLWSFGPLVLRREPTLAQPGPEHLRESLTPRRIGGPPSELALDHAFDAPRISVIITTPCSPISGRASHVGT